MKNEVIKFRRKQFLNEIEKEFGKYLIEKDNEKYKRIIFSRSKEGGLYSSWLFLTFDHTKNIKHLKRINIMKKSQEIFEKFKLDAYEYLHVNALLNLCLENNNKNNLTNLNN